jgi:uncharacterized protein YndB with AHSA1/START domain
MASDKVFSKTIRVNADSAKLWDVLTNPSLIQEWLFGTKVICDWKVGSTILFTGNYQGKDYADKGIVLKFEKEKIFQYTYWSGFSGLPDKPENYSLVTFQVKPEGKESHLTLTQSHFATDTMFEHSDKNWIPTLDLVKKLAEKM